MGKVVVAGNMASLEHSGINYWLDKGWKAAESTEHVLGCLQGRQLGQITLLVLLGPKNRFGASYFQIFLRNDQRQPSDRSVILGLHSSGRYPSYNWIEIISFSERITFGEASSEKMIVSLNGLAQQLFQYLADLIPPGGHMMIEYDSPEQQATARSLAIGIPPAATPLGYLLVSIGCGAGFRNWHFAEGGNEGSRKLQGFKALNSQDAGLKAKDMAQELKSFLQRTPQPGHLELENAARQRALDILQNLELRNPPSDV